MGGGFRRWEDWNLGQMRRSQRMDINFPVTTITGEFSSGPCIHFYLDYQNALLYINQGSYDE